MGVSEAHVMARDGSESTAQSGTRDGGALASWSWRTPARGSAGCSHREPVRGERRRSSQALARGEGLTSEGVGGKESSGFALVRDGRLAGERVRVEGRPAGDRFHLFVSTVLGTGDGGRGEVEGGRGGTTSPGQPEPVA